MSQSASVMAKLPVGVLSTDTRLPPMPATGFRNYWYPVMFSRSLGRRPRVQRLLGEEVLFMRVDGKARAIQGRCPHRGALLKGGKCLAPGVITCPYHGFSFDLATGKCVAALTEGPNSPSVGRLSARTYPVEERCGIVWIYPGTGSPPPLEEDLPEEFLEPAAVVAGRFSIWRANWRVAVDNGVDTAHVPFLHRNHIFVRFKKMPAFARVSHRREGKWLRVVQEDIGFEGDFPRIGRWPRDLRFRRKALPAQTSLRLPGIVRIVFPGKYAHLRWSVPVDEDSTLIFQSLVRPASGLAAFRFRLFYHLWEKWVYHVSFQQDDKDLLVDIDRLVPEQLTQSDAVIVQWRRMAREARQSTAEESATDFPGRAG